MFSLVILAAAMLAPIDAMFARSAKRTGYQVGKLAYEMQTTPQRLTHMLRNEGTSFSVARLMLAPKDFVEAFIEELLTAKGCDKPLTAREVLDLVRPVMATAQGEKRCDKCA